MRRKRSNIKLVGSSTLPTFYNVKGLNLLETKDKNLLENTNNSYKDNPFKESDKKITKYYIKVFGRLVEINPSDLNNVEGFEIIKK